MTDTLIPQMTARQRGRAEVDFLGAASAFANGRLRDVARARYESAASSVEIPTDFEARLTVVKGLADGVKEWRFDEFYMRVVAEELQPAMVYASVEVGGAREGAPEADDLAVPVDPDLDVPEYFDVNFHISPWYSETPRYSYDFVPAVIPRVFNRAGVAAVPIGSNIFEQRKLAVDQARVDSPARILDIGSGGGGAFLGLVQNRYPDAEITGIDLSAHGLTGAARIGASQGRSWNLVHMNGESLDFDDDTFDLVTSYALLHEVPVSATENILAEAFRVLKPGGEMVMIDVPPYRAIPDFQFLVYDWETEGRVEPYWREAGRLHRGELSNQIGFIDVEEYGFGETNYPWVLRAHKPNKEQGK